MIVSLAELYPKYREDIETYQFSDWMISQGLDESLEFEFLLDNEKMQLLDKFYSETTLLH